MRRALTGTRGLALAILIAVTLSAGAVAYWTGIGFGSADMRLADPKTLVLSAGSPNVDLYPGGSANVSVVASNANPYVVHIASLALDTGVGTGGFDVDAAHVGCDVTPLALKSQDNGGKGWNVPPRSGTVDGPLPIELVGALTMGTERAERLPGRGLHRPPRGERLMPRRRYLILLVFLVLAIGGSASAGWAYWTGYGQAVRGPGVAGARDGQRWARCRRRPTLLPLLLHGAGQGGQRRDVHERGHQGADHARRHR